MRCLGGARGSSDFCGPAQGSMEHERERGPGGPARTDWPSPYLARISKESCATLPPEARAKAVRS
jgi:hypothetical protein